MSLYVVTVLILLFFAGAVGIICFECGKRSVQMQGERSATDEVPEDDR